MQDEGRPGAAPRLAIAAAVSVLVGGVVVALVAGGDGDGDGGPGQNGPADAAADVVTVDCDAWNELGGDDATAAPDNTPLAPDGELISGALDNELRYFVRANDRPGRSAMLALAVDAGAALEDEDQHGAAHFLEHMLFNGTEGFPGNELETVLAGLGVELGPDLNAFTNEDATVYLLDLSNDEASIDQGLDVLLEWATRATIDPEDVEDERGVILEEMRGRLGPDDRFFDRMRDLALADTPYEGHEVVGTVESIEAMTPVALRRFYEDWYRPDLMSVIAVGDFDAPAVETEIRERFSSVPAARPGARPRPELQSGLADEPRLASYVDDELAGTSAEVIFTRPAERQVTVDVLRRQLLRDVAVEVLDSRLDDDAARGGVPFYEVDIGELAPVREFESVFLSVDAEPEQLGDALEAVVHELARARRDGLADAEVARAVDERRARAAADLEGAPSTQDRDVVFRLLDVALERGPSTPAEPLARAQLAVLDAMGAAEVTAELRRLTDCTDLAVQVGVPSAYEDELPDEARIRRALSSATEPGAVPERSPEPDAPTSIMATPEPVAPIRRTDAELVYGPAVYLEYANGAQVIVNPSDIQAGFVRIDGESPGGLAEIEQADLPSGRAAARLVNDSGVGDLDPVDLGRALAGKNVSASVELDVATEHVHAAGSVSDAEAIFQLMHQRVVAPRIDVGAVATLRGEARLTVEDPSRRADSAVAAARDELVWRDDPRYRDLPRAADLEGLDIARALELHRERFGDVSDFVFTIVGDIDPATAEDLANRYIGTLPGAGRTDDANHEPPARISGVVTRRVEAGRSPQARIEIVHDVGVAVEPVVRDRAELLVAVLENRLRDRIREELGASYSPSISLHVDEQTDRIRTSIEIESDPAGIDEIATEVQAVVAGLRDPGPTEDDVQRALQPMLRDLAFVNLEQISASWTYVLTHPQAPVADVPAAAELRLADADASVVRELARSLLPADAYVEIVQVPAG